MSVVGSRTERILPLPLQGQLCDYRSGVEADEASEVGGGPGVQQQKSLECVVPYGHMK